MSKGSYAENFIDGESGKLHYLDWGGTGKPLILIHGMGDTPYLFTDLAEELKEHFRIIAYSKRGHGKTETADTSYDNATLVADLQLLLDSLHIEKSSLLGWSAAGNEMTEFAIQYPERTEKLIYLEAGYDLSEEPFSILLRSLPRAPFPDTSDLVSLDAYRNWYHGFWYPDIEWNPILEANLQASVLVNPDKSITPIPNDEIFEVAMRSAMDYQRDYGKVHAPALFFFTRTFFKTSKKDASIVQMYNDLEKNVISPWRAHSMNRIRSEFKNAAIRTLPAGSHTSLLFLDKDLIVASINRFLLE